MTSRNAWGRPTYEVSFQYEGPFPLRQNRVCHLTWPTPRVLWEDMGVQQGELIATNIFLETGQERMKISCKSPDRAFVSNSPRKQRQGLGMKLCPGMWLVSKSHPSLSLSLSLCYCLLHFLSNSPHPMLSVLVQVGISQPGEQSISFNKIFHQSSKILSNTNAFFRK